MIIEKNDGGRMWEKTRKIMHQICDILEFLLAIIVCIALVAAMVMQAPGMVKMLTESNGTEGFIEVLEQIMNMVVGIEFIKMLCKPNPDNVIEVLLFLVARHMIIDENTALDILLSVLSIAILFIVRQAFHIVHERKSQLVNKVAQKIYGAGEVTPNKNNNE